MRFYLRFKLTFFENLIEYINKNKEAVGGKCHYIKHEEIIVMEVNIMTKPRKKSKRISNAEWIRRHLGELVDKHVGKYAIVANGEVFIGQDPVVLEEEAIRKHPGAKLTGIPIPRREDFQCAL